MADNPFVRAARPTKHLNYHELNDGSDDEAEIADRIDPLPVKCLHLASSLVQGSNQFIE
jgi:hypothetical protein